MTDKSKGPFAVEKELAYLGGDMDVGGEEPAMVKLVEVRDASGEPFCYVAPEDCAGGDIAAAKARAQRIAEALNRTVFGPDERKLTVAEYERRADVVVGDQWVYPKGRPQGESWESATGKAGDAPSKDAQP